MIIALMRQLPTPNAQRQVDVFYPRNHHPITMKMQGQESIQVPAGTFLSWKWQGDTDKYNMSLWYDQKSRLPLKVIFVNNHGNRFLLEAKPWQKAHQESD